MNAKTSALVETSSHAQHPPVQGSLAAEEATRFLMRLATDAEGRERFAFDKEAFMEESKMSEDTKHLLRAPNANLLLQMLHEPTAPMKMIVMLEIEMLTNL
ncbi:hypothetical protein [Dyella flagellata]|uniref:Extradiol ring-cleavage dioxygenase LigAB LigA subunit domain-containing protein n=1 Tax=Dyella flagellata TaxID=1867833 RepID=A0ABQ5X7P9_9GAMM|nr:hypothetical protein [Dyella flagellata]GLQ86578.1 hypothetical protein GCM10007898_01440 [Dyella flagellata]